MTVGQLTQTPDGQGFMRNGAAQVTFDQVAVWLTHLNFMDPATSAILLGDSSAARVAAGVKTSLPVAQILVQGVYSFSLVDDPCELKKSCVCCSTRIINFHACDNCETLA